MIKSNYISLVLPCKNEARALKEVFKNIPKGVDEIIVIDNDSTDQTKKIAKQFGAKVLNEPRNKNGIGYGFALEKGIKNTSGNIIICMDGDCSYPAHEIPNLIGVLNSNKLDFISCNRLPFQKKRKMSIIRTFGVKILNLFILLLFGYNINDSLTGMWVFRRKVIPYLTFSEGGWNFSLEIKLNAFLNPNIRFSEYHISYFDRRFDSSKQNIFKTGFGHLLFLFKVRITPQKVLSFPQGNITSLALNHSSKPRIKWPFSKFPFGWG